MSDPQETVYVCLDVEASGPIPDPYNLVSIGAVPVAYHGSSSRWEPLESNVFYIELKPAYDGFDSGAMAIHGISREHLEEHGVEPHAAMQQLTDWVNNLGQRPVFVGHNAVFDWAYVNHYYVRAGLDNPFGWKALDTKSMAAGVLGIPFLATHKENLAELLPGLETEDRSQKHRADYDAIYQARILCELLDYRSA